MVLLGKTEITKLLTALFIFIRLPSMKNGSAALCQSNSNRHEKRKHVYYLFYWFCCFKTTVHVLEVKIYIFCLLWFTTYVRLQLVLVFFLCLSNQIWHLCKIRFRSDKAIKNNKEGLEGTNFLKIWLSFNLIVFSNNLLKWFCSFSAHFFRKPTLLIKIPPIKGQN